MYRVQLGAIGALTFLESVAMLTHTDGAFFLPVSALIGAVAGYSVCHFTLIGGKKPCLDIRKG